MKIQRCTELGTVTGNGAQQGMEQNIMHMEIEQESQCTKIR